MKKKPTPTKPSPPSKIRILRLTLKKKWFDMIASGEKKEEYRQIKPWITSRIYGKEYDIIEFKNGYEKNAPSVVVEYKGYTIGSGRKEWGATGEPVLTLSLGGVLFVSNEQGASCKFDTDGDGNCHKCFKRPGGCPYKHLNLCRLDDPGK